MYIGIFLWQFSQQVPLSKEEYSFGEGEMMLTRHYRAESKNLGGQKSIAPTGGLLRAIGFSRKVGKKESEERSKGRPR